MTSTSSLVDDVVDDVVDYVLSRCLTYAGWPRQAVAEELLKAAINRTFGLVLRDGKVCGVAVGQLRDGQLHIEAIAADTTVDLKRLLKQYINNHKVDVTGERHGKLRHFSNTKLKAIYGRRI